MNVRVTQIHNYAQTLANSKFRSSEPRKRMKPQGLDFTSISNAARDHGSI